MKALVLKTSERESVPWVRIPPSPPFSHIKYMILFNKLISPLIRVSTLVYTTVSKPFLTILKNYVDEAESLKRHFKCVRVIENVSWLKAHLLKKANGLSEGFNQ